MSDTAMQLHVRYNAATGGVRVRAPGVSIEEGYVTVATLMLPASLAAAILANGHMRSNVRRVFNLGWIGSDDDVVSQIQTGDDQLDAQVPVIVAAGRQARAKHRHT